jgi:hypothetical protein
MKEHNSTEYIVCEYDEPTNQYFARAEFTDRKAAEKRLNELKEENPKLCWCLVNKFTTFEIEK